MIWLLACQSEKTDSTPIDSTPIGQESGVLESTPDSPGDTDPGGESDPNNESDPRESDPGGDSSPDTEGPDHDYTVGFSIVEDQDEAYAWAGYRVSTIEITSDFEVPITTIDGLPPRFRIVWPVSPDASHDYPVLLALHGASADYYSKEDPDGADDRCTQEHGDSSSLSMVNDSAFAEIGALKDWVVIAPSNGFCDGWHGFGIYDPVDPNRAGQLFVQLIMGWIRWGQDRLSVDEDRFYVLGTSIGVPGALYSATRNPGLFAGVVPDSGPTNMVRYYYEEDYSPLLMSDLQARYDQIFGGPPYDDVTTETPSAWWVNYQDASLIHAAEAGTLTTPIFHIWNTQDVTSTPVQHEEVTPTLESVYTPAGIRWEEYDFDHGFPSHIQVRNLESFYASWAMFRFFDSEDLWIIEGEDHVGDVGILLEGDPLASRGGRAVASAIDGPGTLVEAPLSATLPAGALLNATFFVQIEGAEDPTATAATVELREDGVVLASAELSELGNPVTYPDPSTRWGAVTNATLEATPTGGSLSLVVTVSGTAQVAVDMIVADY